MSDNSYIYIKRTKKGYTVTHSDADTNLAYSVNKFKTLEDAVYEAEQLQNGLCPEFGIVLDLIRTKEVL